MRKKAAIIGGSMSGLFAANFLQKINWDFTVHEMVPSTLSGRGAGIATYDELAKLVEITTGFSKTLGTKCFDRVVFDNKNIVMSKKHYPQVFTSWQYLYDILLSQINKNKYFLGDECLRIERKKDCTTAFFKNGKKITADLIIIANGIRSNLKQYVDKNKPEYAGYVGWRGLIEESRLSKKTSKAISDYFCFVLPQNQQFLSYPVAGTGKNGLKNGNRRINWLWYKPVNKNDINTLLTGKSNKRYEHGIPPQEIKDIFIRKLIEEGKEKLPDTMNELIVKTEQILLQPIYDLKSKRMFKDNVIIIGDCAFTARPHAGMGVTKAALDCYDLTLALKKSNLNNINELLSRWEEKRINESMFLLNKSREMGSYIKEDLSIKMPDNMKVLNETAVSIQDINLYPDKLNLINI